MERNEAVTEDAKRVNSSFTAKEVQKINDMQETSPKRGTGGKVCPATCKQKETTEGRLYEEIRESNGKNNCAKKQEECDFSIVIHDLEIVQRVGPFSPGQLYTEGNEEYEKETSYVMDTGLKQEKDEGETQLVECSEFS